MRRQTVLKTDPRQGTGRTPLKPVVTGPVDKVTSANVERNVLSTLRDIERVMEESFHRPFFGLNTFPIRQMFHGLGVNAEFIPAVDIFEQKGEVIVKTDLPGLNRDDITLKIVGNSIIISGDKKTEERVERKDYLRVERSYGSFNRTLNLPEGVDTEHVTASFKDGVLEIRLPKTGTTGLGRQISVK